MNMLTDAMIPHHPQIWKLLRALQDYSDDTLTAYQDALSQYPEVGDVRFGLCCFADSLGAAGSYGIWWRLRDTELVPPAADTVDGPTPARCEWAKRLVVHLRHVLRARKSLREIIRGLPRPMWAGYITALREYNANGYHGYVCAHASRHMRRAGINYIVDAGGGELDDVAADDAEYAEEFPSVVWGCLCDAMLVPKAIHDHCDYSYLRAWYADTIAAVIGHELTTAYEGSDEPTA